MSPYARPSQSDSEPEFPKSGARQPRTVRSPTVPCVATCLKARPPGRSARSMAGRSCRAAVAQVGPGGCQRVATVLLPLPAAPRRPRTTSPGPNSQSNSGRGSRGSLWLSFVSSWSSSRRVSAGDREMAPEVASALLPLPAAPGRARPTIARSNSQSTSGLGAVGSSSESIKLFGA